MSGRRALFVLSGCGNRDGSEIHESVCAMLALERAGFDILFAAPDTPQAATVSHVDGRPVASRNAMEEAARIARGSIRRLSEVSHSEYDCVVFPGGMGAAQTLCTYATEGRGCHVLPEVEKLVRSASESGRPIAAMCIAPVILAALIPGVTITLGSEGSVAADARAMGANHVVCAAGEACLDEDYRVVTTPAYMVARSPVEVYDGAVSMVEELASLL